MPCSNVPILPTYLPMGWDKLTPVNSSKVFQLWQFHQILHQILSVFFFGRLSFFSFPFLRHFWHFSITFHSHFMDFWWQFSVASKYFQLSSLSLPPISKLKNGHFYYMCMYIHSFPKNAINVCDKRWWLKMEADSRRHFIFAKRRKSWYENFIF